MKDLIDKLSSYNLFNYLLPGVVYCSIVNEVTSYEIPLSNIFLGGFLCYYIGLSISRFGSLIIEPILKKFKIIEFVNYSDFLIASEKDPKIEYLSENNNVYRTSISLFLLIILTKLYNIAAQKLVWLSLVSPYILCISLIILFLYSYRKQTSQIVKRVKSIR